MNLMLLFRVGKNKTVPLTTQIVCELFLIHSVNQFNEVIDRNIMVYIFVKQE